MTKTRILSGEEIKVKDIGGFNTVVHNLGDDVIYASKCPYIEPGADNVAEIPPGAAKLIGTTNGIVYLLGTGKVELTGQDYEGVNCSLPSTAVYSGTSEVTKRYVDEQINALNNAKADKSEIPIVSNLNLLDNWFFSDPINQRGQTTYTGGRYTIDRWFVESGRVELTDDGLLCTTADQVQTIIQFVEPERLKPFANKTVTLSILAGPSKGGRQRWLNSTVFHFNSSATGITEGKALYKETSQVGMTPAFLSSTRPQLFRIHVNNPTRIYAVKLELGDNQTLCHKDLDGNWVINEIPDYGTQLAKCQRYQVIGAANDTSIYGYVEISGDVSTIIIPTPVTLRATPTLTIPELLCQGGGGSVSVKDFSYDIAVEPSSTIRASIRRTPDFGTAIGARNVFTGYMSKGYIIDANI